MAPPPSRRGGGRPLRVSLLLAALLLSTFAIFLSFSLLAPFFPQHAAANNISDPVVGAIFATYPGSSFVGSLVIGPNVKRLGRRPTIIVGVAACTLASAGFAALSPLLVPLPPPPLNATPRALQTPATVLRNSYVAFIASNSSLPSPPSLSSGTIIFIVFAFLMRLLQGLGSACVNVVCLSLVAVILPDKLSLFEGLVETVVGAGYAAGPTLGSFLYEGGGFALPFVVVAGVLAVCIVPLVLLVPADEAAASASTPSLAESVNAHVVADASDGDDAFRGDDADNVDEALVAEDAVASAERIDRLPDAPFLEIVRNPVVLIVTIGFALLLAMFGFADPVLAPLLANPPYALSQIDIGLVFLACSGTYTLLSVLVGLFADRFERTHIVLLVAGYVIAGVGALLMGPVTFVRFLSSSTSLMVFAMVLQGIGASLAIVVSTPLALHAFDDDECTVSNPKNTAAGIITSGFPLGEVVGPLIAPPLVAWLGFDNAVGVFFFALSAWALVALVALPLVELRRRRRRRARRANGANRIAKIVLPPPPPPAAAGGERAPLLAAASPR